MALAEIALYQATIGRDGKLHDLGEDQDMDRRAYSHLLKAVAELGGSE